MDILGVTTPNGRNVQVEEAQRLKVGDGSVEIIRDKQGQGWVVVKKVCEILGVDSRSQQRRVTKKPWAIIKLVRLPGLDGKRYEHLCISVDCVVTWLNTLVKSRVKGSPTTAYFIRSRRTGLIKIGTSSNAMKRLQGLAKSYPDCLELLAVGGVEEELHQSLAGYRVHGEWFKPHKDVLLALRAVGGDPSKPIAVAGMKGIDR